MRIDIPNSVVDHLAGQDGCELLRVASSPVGGATGAATDDLARLTLRLRTADGHLAERQVVRKTLRPLRSGPHRHGAEDPTHWAYWRRELLAYGSGVLPEGPGLRAPRCLGVFGSTLYLEDVGPAVVDAELAAKHLAAWQSTASASDVPWLSGHQLAQRIAATNLDWTAVEADARAEALWSARQELLARLAALPMVLSHGDFHQDNLRADDGDTVALDWGTFGLAPAGADLAHLALSTRKDLVPAYLAAAEGRFEERQVVNGYRCTLVLVGASRAHWMLARGIEPPPGYVDFLWANRPDAG